MLNQKIKIIFSFRWSTFSSEQHSPIAPDGVGLSSFSDVCGSLKK